MAGGRDVELAIGEPVAQAVGGVTHGDIEQRGEDPVHVRRVVHHRRGQALVEEDDARELLCDTHFDALEKKTSSKMALRPTLPAGGLVALARGQIKKWKKLLELLEV